MPTLTYERILSDDSTPLKFIDEHEEALFHESRIGEEAIRFLESDLGILLKGRATLDIQEAQSALLAVDPEDTATIRTLQTKAAVARQFVSWIADAIQNGDQAYEQLRAMRN